MEELEFHEIASLFPLMFGEEFAGIREDIKKNGLQEPIILYEGKILDGRNRYLICKELNIEPELKEFKGDNPVSYIISKNMFRRHLNLYQKTKIAILLLPKYAEKAKEQKIEAGRRYGKKHPKGKVSLNSQKPIDAVKEACKVVGIGTSSYYESKFVQEKIKEISKGELQPLRKLQADGMECQLEEGEVTLNSAYNRYQAIESEKERAKKDDEEAMRKQFNDEIERAEVLKERRKARKAKAERLKAERPLILWQNLKNAVNEYSEWYYIHEDFLKDETVLAIIEGIREACKVLGGIKSRVEQKAGKLLQGTKDMTDITPEGTVSKETTEEVEKEGSKIIDAEIEEGGKEVNNGR